MADSTIAQFLTKLERSTKRAILIEQTAMVSIPAILVGIAGAAAPFAAMAVNGSSPPNVFAELLWRITGFVLGSAVGGLIGLYVASTYGREIQEDRRQMRRMLVDKGLLGLVLEPNASDRLPRLVPWRDRLLRRKTSDAEAGTLELRLKQFIETYSACTVDAGLATTTRQAESRRNLLAGIGCVGFLVATFLVARLPPGFIFLLYLPGFLIKPWLDAQTGKRELNKAVRLEVAAALRSPQRLN